MPPKLTEQIPLAALRDLIGICRALYAAWKDAGIGPVQLEELARIGHELGQALKLARETRPDSVGHRAAWARAEAATKRLGQLIDELEPIRPTIVAASKRVCGTSGPSAQKLREAKKKHVRMRN